MLQVDLGMGKVVRSWKVWLDCIASPYSYLIATYYCYFHLVSVHSGFSEGRHVQ